MRADPAEDQRGPRRGITDHLTALAALASAVATAVIGYLSVSTVRDVAADTESAQRQALLRSERMSAYTAYVADLEKHRLLLSNAPLTEQGPADGAGFYTDANVLIPTLAADEKRIRLIATPETVTAMDALRRARLTMYNEFVCNSTLQEACREYQPATRRITMANLDTNRRVVDDALTAFITSGRAEVMPTRDPDADD